MALPTPQRVWDCLNGQLASRLNAVGYTKSQGVPEWCRPARTTVMVAIAADRSVGPINSLPQSTHHLTEARPLVIIRKALQHTLKPRRIARDSKVSCQNPIVASVIASAVRVQIWPFHSEPGQAPAFQGSERAKISPTRS